MQTGLFGETFNQPDGKPKTSVKATSQPSGLAEAIGITSGHLRDFAKGAALPEGVIKEAWQLTHQYCFFHWHLAFPEVFKRDGFDVILGNPPWEHVELKEKEWFAERRPGIANAPNDAARKRLIEALKTEAPSLHAEFQTALRQTEGESHLMRSSGLYPLCGRGRINLYPVFAEGIRNHLSLAGRMGTVLPSGIASDDTTKFFFQDLVEKHSLVSLFDFENKGIFVGVHSSYKFCLFTSGGPKGRAAEVSEFAFFAHSVDDLRDPQRRFTLSSDDITRLNPNTRTCPIFRSRRDAELTKFIYGRVPVLLREGPPAESAWDIRFRQGFFNMATDSHLFRTRLQLESEGWRLEGNAFCRNGIEYWPLYEAKMTNLFDHRHGSILGSEDVADLSGIPAQATTLAEHQNPNHRALPRYWVPKQAVEDALNRTCWNRHFLLNTRDVARGTDVRTAIQAAIPIVGVGHKAPLILPMRAANGESALLLANFNAFVLDFIVRQKIGGASLSFFIIKQLPILPPATYAQPNGWTGGTETLKEWLLPRVLELAYTAWDLEAFAHDCSWFGPPFRWDEDRRFQLRCELDAAFFRLYGLNRDDTAYILDTFPIVKRKDEEKFGAYRTKDRILELYDAVTECQRKGIAYQTKLAPIAASFRATHAPRLPTSKRIALESADKFLLSFIYSFLKQTHHEATFGLLDSIFHLLRQRANHASEFNAAVGDSANVWLSGFNDKPSNDAFLPFLRRLEADGWITADRTSGRLTITDKFPAVPLDAWRNYDVSAALRVIAERPDIAELVISQPNTALASREFSILKTA
jgi:hypothetical protein